MEPRVLLTGFAVNFVDKLQQVLSPPQNETKFFENPGRSWTTLLLIFFLTAANSQQSFAFTCADLLALRGRMPEKVNPLNTQTHWISLLKFGNFDMLAVPDYKGPTRKVIGFTPRKALGIENLKQIHEPVEMYLMPHAKENQEVYFSVSSFTQRTGQTTVRLFDITQEKHMKSLADWPLELVWTTYLKNATVGESDIESFKATEDDLSMRRKTYFVTTVESEAKDQVLAVIRLFDGSPDPAMYIGNHRSPSPATARMGDASLPIERRYPHINIREDGDFVFEAGRLAGDPSLEKVLELQFFNIGSFLKNKYGFASSGPKEFLHQGRVYVEITGQHLRTYMTPIEKGGLGFKLYAHSVHGQEMTRSKEDKSYETFAAHRKDPAARFILFKNIDEFIEDFHDRSPLGPSQGVPGYKPNQNNQIFNSPFDPQYHQPLPQGWGSNSWEL